jgi:ribosomal-protein-alanine N-acetyltransferase
MTEIRLRPLEPADLPAVLWIERVSYSVPWSEATFRGLLRRRDADLLVAVAGYEVVGYAIFWTVLDQSELGNVAVAPGWRGRGIGEQLVAEVLRIVGERGVRELFLEVRPSNAPARRLYERFGFTQVGRRRNYYQAPVEDALILRRPLRVGSSLNRHD